MMLQFDARTEAVVVTNTQPVVRGDGGTNPVGHRTWWSFTAPRGADIHQGDDWLCVDDRRYQYARFFPGSQTAEVRPRP